MFNISEKYSGKEKRNTIGYYKGREEERQVLRKKLHPVSRELDNYFYSSLHKRGWWPNGRFIRKKYYYYAEPGLGCFYEKNNVAQLKDLRELKNAVKKKELKTFVEYSYIEDNQYAITIEYCSNCEEHQTYTFHKSELYKNYAINLQKCILLRFPFIKVILKPIDTDILKEEKYKLPKVDLKGNFEKQIIINDKFKDVRIGAFEVQICFKKNGGELKKALLHSKLETKQFPQILRILDKIVSYLPTFSGKIITYEKEENINENTKDNLNDEYNQKGFLEELQINIYLLNNIKIQNLAKEAWSNIQNQLDPHKRQIMIKEQKIRKKENMFKKNDSSIISYANRSRPMSSLTVFGGNHKSQSMINLRPNTSKTFILGNNNNNVNNFIFNDKSFLSSSIAFRTSINSYILDKDKSKSLKGKLILTKYTNKDGEINIGPLPYDSYYIEVQENKQYRSVGISLTFNTINLKNKNYIQKYIGLFTQENSFIQLHVYEINKDQKGGEDPIHLGKAKVTLKRINNFNSNDDNGNSNNYSQKDENFEKKIKINEKNNTPGIFEHTVPPGKYLLEVEKSNYETIRKFIELEKGANYINVEMNAERCCNLHIFAYNYEKFQEESYVPIHNADVIIYQNSEILEETITNNKGEANYIVSKGEDFLTLVVCKLGYYPVQRIFIRNKDIPINESGEYEDNLTFFLVKENFIIDNNCILCVTYSNLIDENFDPNAIQISDNIKDRITLSCFDGQKENGIISTFIKYETKKENNQNDNDNNNLTDKDEEQSNNNLDNESETENFDDIISVSFIIQTESLKNNNYQDKGFTMNGLERYGCQTIIYTPKNIFYITAPGFCKEGYSFWNLGWIDIKNQLFYQTNTLTESLNERTLYFSYWLEFLQTLIDNKIYSKLFEFFCFDKAILLNNDRYIYDNLFIQKLKELNFCKENEDNVISFITSFFKNKNKMLSFSLIKKKISSNLKNFSEGATFRKNFVDDNNQNILSYENETNNFYNNENYEDNNEEI